MSQPESATPAKTHRWYVLLLVGLPVWLACSAGGALWWYFEKEKREAVTRQAAFAREISITSLADDLRKFTTLIGERNVGEGSPSANLGRAASMIEGLLGPSNTGLEIRRVRGPLDWPLLETSLPASRPNAPSVWVITGYDAPRGSRGGQFNASGLAAVLAAIQAAAADKPEKHLRFLFLPHLHDTGAPVGATLRLAAETMTRQGEVEAVLWVEAMGAASDLTLSANSPDALPADLLVDLGSVAPGGHGLPAGDPVPAWLTDAIVRVSTRGPYADGDGGEEPPSPTLTADAAGKLLELLRRMGGG